MLKLKFQCFGHLMRTDDSLEKSLIMEKINSTRGHQRVRWLDGITDATNMNLGKLRKIMKDRKAWPLQSTGSQRGGLDWATKQ